MIDKIENWIGQTLKEYSIKMISCGNLFNHLGAYYPEEFLLRSYYVVLGKIPRPDFPELRQAGFGNFIDADFDGITYKNIYFVKLGKEGNLRLHFHELVHVLQWEILGAKNFINCYMSEIMHFGYKNAPLEKMAYQLDYRFFLKRSEFNVPYYVRHNL